MDVAPPDGLALPATGEMALTVVATGLTVVATGLTVVTTGLTVVATGLTVVATGLRVVAVSGSVVDPTLLLEAATVAEELTAVTGGAVVEDGTVAEAGAVVGTGTVVHAGTVVGTGPIGVTRIVAGRVVIRWVVTRWVVAGCGVNALRFVAGSGDDTRSVPGNAARCRIGATAGTAPIVVLVEGGEATLAIADGDEGEGAASACAEPESRSTMMTMVSTDPMPMRRATNPRTFLAIDRRQSKHRRSSNRLEHLSSTDRSQITRSVTKDAFLSASSGPGGDQGDNPARSGLRGIAGSATRRRSPRPRRSGCNRFRRPPPPAPRSRPAGAGRCRPR